MPDMFNIMKKLNESVEMPEVKKTLLVENGKLAETKLHESVESAKEAPVEKKDMSKEEIEAKLANLLTTIADGQLSDDELEAMEKEVDELEKLLADKEMLGESANSEADGKVGGDYNSFIYDLQNIREWLVNIHSECYTDKSQQFAMDLVDKFDSLVDEYERELGIEISGAMNESAKPEKKSEKKPLKEEAYGEGIYGYIEEALEGAGFDVTRYNDYGMLTKNLGWVVEKNGETAEISCDGTWLDETAANSEDETLKETAANSDEELKESADMEIEGDLTECAHQGDIYMLTDGKKFYVGKNYNNEEPSMDDVKVYSLREEADEDYIGRLDIVTGGEQNKPAMEQEESSVDNTINPVFVKESAKPVSLSSRIDSVLTKLQNEEDFIPENFNKAISDDAIKLSFKDKSVWVKPEDSDKAIEDKIRSLS